MGCLLEVLVFSLPSSKSNIGVAIGGNKKFDPRTTVEEVVLTSEGKE